jgi:hypothetical protein
VLIFAALVAFSLGHYNDAIIIAVILMANSIIGSVQEGRAERAISSLKKLASPVVKVKREGMISEIPSREVVPGCIIIFETGDKIPADARLIAGINLKIDESILTGESVASEKYAVEIKPEAKITEQKNMVFSGTSVVAGHGDEILRGGRIFPSVVGDSLAPAHPGCQLVLRLAGHSAGIAAHAGRQVDVKGQLRHIDPSLRLAHPKNRRAGFLARLDGLERSPYPFFRYALMTNNQKGLPWRKRTKLAPGKAILTLHPNATPQRSGFDSAGKRLLRGPSSGRFPHPGRTPLLSAQVLVVNEPGPRAVGIRQPQGY